jgi:thiol peroxidase
MGIIYLKEQRLHTYGDLYGLTIADGPLAGLLARAILGLDTHHHVVYHELVTDISKPPNYPLALDQLSAP